MKSLDVTTFIGETRRAIFSRFVGPFDGDAVLKGKGNGFVFPFSCRQKEHLFELTLENSQGGDFLLKITAKSGRELVGVAEYSISLSGEIKLVTRRQYPFKSVEELGFIDLDDFFSANEGHFLFADPKGRYLYKYKKLIEWKPDGSFDYFNSSAKQAINGDLYAPLFCQLNDPFERFGAAWRSDDRVLAFAETYDNLLLWTHYADQRKGVCLKYSLASIGSYLQTHSLAKAIVYGKVFYASKAACRAHSILHCFFSAHSQATVQEIVLSFVKEKDWSYEKEYRVLLLDPSIHLIPITPEVVYVFHQSGLDLSSVIKRCPLQFVQTNSGTMNIELDGPDPNSLGKELPPNPHASRRSL